MRKNSLAIKTVLLCCLFSVLLLAGPAPAAAAPPETAAASWKIGILLPLSGHLAAIGQQERRAFTLGMEQVNRQGGIKGRRLELLFIDTAGDPRQAVTSLEKAVDDNDDLLLLAGGVNSAATWAAARYAEHHHRLLLINTASSPRLTQEEWQYVFRLNQVDEEYLTAPVSRYLHRLDGPLKAAVLYADEICPTETARELRRVCARLHLDLAVWNRFSPGKAGYQRLLTQIKEQEPEILFLVGSQADAAVILRGCRQLPKPPAEIFLCDPQFSCLGAKEQYGELFTGVKTAALWGPFLDNEKSTAFARNFRDTYQEQPDYHAAQAYACLEVIVDLLRRSLLTTADDLRQTLAAAELATVYGPVSFVSDELFTNQNRLTGHLVVWQTDRFIPAAAPQAAAGSQPAAAGKPQQ
ncbi:MAG: ABC transporter substrate-binding protein [Deltaproteobacteria bacterium]|nr:ABC transporter substrate-binding protein [Deltaproteobacteria bacterium]